MEGKPPPPEAQRLRSVVLDAADFDLEDRADLVRDYFAPAMDISFISENDAPPTGRVEMWQLGSILVMDGASGDIELTRCSRQVARDDLDHWMLRVMRHGQVVSRSGDRVYRQSGGEVVLDSMTNAFEDRWNSSGWVSFMIPREGFESLSFLDQQRGPLKGAPVRLFGDFALSLVDHLRGAQATDAAPLTEVTQGMIRSCLLRAVTPGAISQNDVAQLDREHVRSVIRRNLASPRLTPERICELTGLSRSALYRLFEAQGGVGHYIQEQRLRLVMQDLSDPTRAKESISALAEARGFYNAPAFSRLFRRHFGCTPSEARQAAFVGARLVDDEPNLAGHFVQLLG